MAARSNPRWFHKKGAPSGIATELMMRQEGSPRSSHSAGVIEVRPISISPTRDASASDRSGRACLPTLRGRAAMGKGRQASFARAKGGQPRLVADDASAQRRRDPAVGRIAISW